MAKAQEPNAQDSNAQNSSAQAPKDLAMPNVKTPTLGGKQLWTDYRWRLGWHIQKNALTGHWRLLDPQQVRHAWGSRVACEASLDKLVPQCDLPTQHVVILLHGLMRTSSSMAGLGEYVTQTTKLPVALFEYASTRASISDHAAALRELVADLPPDVKLSFIGHSMGNIVVRHALGDWQRAEDQKMLQRIQNIIMLGPPNQGASIARQLSKTGIFGWVTGEGGLELGPKWIEFEKKLSIPTCPFGIVAGNLPDSSFRNPLVEGASDFVVSVEETKLPGATDFLEVPRLHSFLMDDPTVQKAVANFLQHNHF